jgi:hypothetical protein
LAQQTYEKSEWTQDDLRILRGCWKEFERRGGENAVMFFRPAFFGLLKVHEVESGEVDEGYVRMLERTGSEIAQDYWEIMRKPRAVDVTPYENPKHLEFEEWEALEELARITSQEGQNEPPES